ncbi:MAG: hypothetical protein ACREAC_19405, partial [Blastocatellia bacterium]
SWYYRTMKTSEPESDTRAQTLKPTSPEAKKFVDAARQIFSVSKEELNKREAEWQQAHAKASRKKVSSR